MGKKDVETKQLIEATKQAMSCFVALQEDSVNYIAKIQGIAPEEIRKDLNNLAGKTLEHINSRLKSQEALPDLNKLKPLVPIGLKH